MHASPSAGLPSTLPPLSGPAPAAEERSAFATVWLLSLAALLLIFASLLMVALAGGIGAAASVRGVAVVFAIVLTAVGAVALTHVRRLARTSDILGASPDERGTREPALPVGLRIAVTVPSKGWPPVSSLARARHRERPRQAQAIAAAREQAMRRPTLQSRPAEAPPPRPSTAWVPVARQWLSMPASSPVHAAFHARATAPMTRAQAAALQIGVAGFGRPHYLPVRRGPTAPTIVRVSAITGAPPPTLSRSAVRTVSLRPPNRQ
jgi:hypothetical protein